VRTIAGTTTLHLELERKLAEFKRADACITFQSGFTANLATVPALTGEGDLIFSDELNHASIIDACRLSKARTIRYAHNDIADLRRKLAKLKEEAQSRKGATKRDSAFRIPKAGAGQAVVIGPANVGKSALVAALTGADAEVSPIPNTTWEPLPAMMPVETKPTVKVPITAPVTVPTPPQVGVPPTNTAARVLNKKPSPVFGQKMRVSGLDRIATQPAAMPTYTKAIVLTPATLMPISRALSWLSPTQQI
jgi:hypothetical protein